DAGSADGLADTECCQLARGDVLQAAAVAADRRPRPAQDDDLPCISHRKVSCEEISSSPTSVDFWAEAASVPEQKRCLRNCPTCVPWLRFSAWDAMLPWPERCGWRKLPVRT